MADFQTALISAIADLGDLLKKAVCLNRMDVRYTLDAAFTKWQRSKCRCCQQSGNNYQDFFELLVDHVILNLLGEVCR
jgi:hypothetical protein